VDIFRDQYFHNSLEAQTREKRASVPIQQRRVWISGPTPNNWQQFLFLCLSNNKTDLLKFLDDEPMEKAVLMDYVHLHDIQATLLPATMRKQIVVHVGDAVMQDFHKILV